MFLLIHNQKQLHFTCATTVPVCCHIVQLLAFEGRLASFGIGYPESTVQKLQPTARPSVPHQIGVFPNIESTIHQAIRSSTTKKCILLCLAIDPIKLEKPWNHIYLHIQYCHTLMLLLYYFHYCII